MTAPPEPSPLESLKRGSRYLRGRIAEELANDEDAFTADANGLLKHHGAYQQDDRDRRKLKDAKGKPAPKAHSLMVRVKIPGGRLAADQLLALLDLCDELGNTTARITDRQDIQLHGVPKRNLREAIRRINKAQLTTLGACGDVERNVMCCPAPLANDPVRRAMQELAARLSSLLLPQTTAYREIWLSDPSGGGMVPGGVDEDREIEPLYSPCYLPRKFKIALASPDDNCVDLYANDLGLLALAEGSRIVGYNVLVGGGLGVTPSNKRTFPALALPMASIAPEEVLDVAAAVIRAYRDFGDRTDRKRARLKYLIADWGLPRFRAKVEEYYGRTLADPRPVAVWGFDDHLGWHGQGDGRWFYGLNVENGRILDRDGLRLKAALREICDKYRPGIGLTPHQSILVSDIPPDGRAGLEAVLRGHGVRLSEETSNVRRWSMACVALPTCPLAVTESERVLPGLMDRLEAEVARLGLSGERFTVRMTGCPNGCSRPYNADVGLVGRTMGKYAVYLGGRLYGDRLGFLLKDHVKIEELVPLLVSILACFKAERQAGETLGDFCHRKGPAELASRAERAGHSS